MIFSIDWQALSSQLVTTFAHFLWQGALIGIVLAVLLRFLASRTASTRYVISAGAFALLPLCVGCTFAVVHRTGDTIFISPVAKEAAQPTIVRSMVGEGFSSAGIKDVTVNQLRPAMQLPQMQAAELTAPVVVVRISWSSWLTTASPYLFAVYLGGVAISLFRLVSSVWMSGQLRHSMSKIEDSAIARIISTQATRMGLRRIPAFGLCEHISVPVVVGILKPTILLPPAILCGLDPQQLAAILSHEMAHIRRYDLLINMMQRIVEALLFFHPVTWWISRRISSEREDCCDDLAVAGCGRLEFASALLYMAELCAKKRGLAIGSELEAMAADGGKQSQLTRRVHRLLGEVDAPRFVLSRFSDALAVAATLLLTVSVMAFAQPQADKDDDSKVSSASRDGSTDYDVTQFARLPARYTHLVYDQSVRDPTRGLRPERVVQRLPKDATAVQPANPFTEGVLTAGRRDRIRSAYPTFQRGQSIEVNGNSVLLRNAQTGSEKVLVRGIVRENNFSRILARVAISPDQKRIAATIFTGGDGGEFVNSPLFDLYIIDLSADVPQSKLLRTGVHGDGIMGGALWPAAVAPPIFWADDENLLVSTPNQRMRNSLVGWLSLEHDREPTKTELADMSRANGILSTVVVRDDGEVLTPTHDLLRIGLRKNSSKKVCDLKLGTSIGGHQTSTDFWRRSDGAIMLRSRGSDIRIDLAKSEAVVDRSLSPHYELRGDRFKPSLWHGDEQLADVIHFHNVGVSPDGRSVAWYSRTNARDTSNLGNTSQYPTTLWFHSPDTGTVKLAEGNFAWGNYRDVFDNPILRPRFHWLTQTDFVAQPNAAVESAEKPSSGEDYTELPIAWGEPLSGLRMGVRPMEIAKRRIRFRQGDWIRYEVWIKNESDETVVIQRDPRNYFGPKSFNGEVNLMGGSIWASFSLPIETLEEAKLVLASGESQLYCTTQTQFIDVKAKRKKYGPTPLRLNPGQYPLFAEFAVSFTVASDEKNGHYIRLRCPSSQIEVLLPARLQIHSLVEWEHELQESQRRIKVENAAGVNETLVADLSKESLLDEDDILAVNTIAEPNGPSKYSVTLILRPSGMRGLQHALASSSGAAKSTLFWAVFADGEWLASPQLKGPILDNSIVLASSVTKEQAEEIATQIRKLLPKRIADHLDLPVAESDQGNANKNKGTSSLVAVPLQQPQVSKPTETVVETDETPAVNENTANAGDVEGVSPLAHYAGTVLGPDGKPIQGAEVFVIADWNENKRLGPVRDVTGSDGKFSFDATDMTWQALGKTMRRGGLIVAKKQGFVPEWMETWGHSRGIFSTGLWGETKKQTLELQLSQDDVPIRGQLLSADGKPLVDARVRLTRIMIPRNRDLTEFLNHWSKSHVSATFLTGINYKREINKHFELMNLKSDLVTDAEGRFELSGIGRDRIAQLEVTAPSIVTTRIQVMTRESEDVGILLDGFEGKGKPTQTIHGANFSVKLKTGLTVTGIVRDRDTKQPVAGMWVTTGGYSPLTAPRQTQGVVVTGADGRFTIRGLNPKLLEYEKESTRSISAIPQPGVQYLRAGTVFEKAGDTVIETARGIGYRLKVVNEEGEPVKALVKYIRINPNAAGLEMTNSVGGGRTGFLNHAARREDGTYEGFVLPGPGAVVVSVPGNKYRPASVNPKRFFAPGKTWDDDSTYTYGTHSVLATAGGWTDPRKYEAVVLVNPAKDSEPLVLTATLLRDQPRTISLVDSEGKPVFGAIARMHERYGTSHVNTTISGSSFPFEGLNIDKDQWTTFLHVDRKLSTVVAIRGDNAAGVTVQMQPWGTVKGRFVTEDGKPVVIKGKSKFSTVVRNAAHGAKEFFGHEVHEDGTFQIEGFAPGQKYSTTGTYRKQKNYVPGGMFDNLVLTPGEVRDLGDIVVTLP